MRVVTKTADDFLENLRGEQPGTILQGTVYLSVHRNPIDGTKQTASKFLVTVQASCVVDLGDDGQYILEYGEEVGVDYEDASQDAEGTAMANVIRRKITEHCDDAGLRVRPGVVEP